MSTTVSVCLSRDTVAKLKAFRRVHGIVDRDGRFFTLSRLCENIIVDFVDGDV